MGNVTLKGRTSATKTWEVLGLRNRVSSKQSSNSEIQDETLIRGVQKHTQAYALYMERRFSEAKSVFNEAHETISSALGEEGLSLHFVHLCNEYISNPPCEDWNGSETLM